MEAEENIVESNLEICRDYTKYKETIFIKFAVILATRVWLQIQFLRNAETNPIYHGL